jgi:hypothetical protein
MIFQGLRAGLIHTRKRGAWADLGMLVLIICPCVRQELSVMQFRGCTGSVIFHDLCLLLSYAVAGTYQHIASKKSFFLHLTLFWLICCALESALGGFTHHYLLQKPT